MSQVQTHCAMSVMWCQSFTVKDGRRVPAEVKPGRHVCDQCRVYISRALRYVHRDWLKLLVTIGEDRRVQADVQTRRPKPGSRVLINLDGDQMMRDIVDTLNEAADIVARANGLERPEADRLARRGYSVSTTQEYRLIEKATTLISGHLDDLLGDVDGPTLMICLLRTRRNVVRHLGESAQREKKSLPCPSCGAQALVKEVQDRRQVDGTTPEVVRCLACNGGPHRDGTWTEAEYEWLSTMVRSEREEIDVYKWLLAEAQWRLAQIQGVIEKADVNAWAGNLKYDIEEYLP